MGNLASRIVLGLAGMLALAASVPLVSFYTADPQGTAMFLERATGGNVLLGVGALWGTPIVGLIALVRASRLRR